jgi:tetratricopeptide (TPR) repeat protein
LCYSCVFFCLILVTAMSIVSELFGAAHPKIGIYSVNLGDIERKLGDFEKAEVAYGRAIPLLEAALGPDNVELADALNSQGLVLKKKADYDGAEVLYRRALTIILKTFNALHYKAGQVQNNLADCYRKRGQYPEALRIYEEAQAALMASMGPTHSETAEVWHNIALVLHQLGRYTEALELFHKAIAVIEKEFGKAHYKMGVFQNNCGLSYAMAGDFPKAYELLTLALEILRKKLGNDHVEVADSLASLGDVCMKLFVQMNAKDKLAEAKGFYEEANRIVLVAFGPAHPKSLSFASLLAICESQAEQVLARDQRPIELVQIVMYDVSGSMETKVRNLLPCTSTQFSSNSSSLRRLRSPSTPCLIGERFPKHSLELLSTRRLRISIRTRWDW